MFSILWCTIIVVVFWQLYHLSHHKYIKNKIKLIFVHFFNFISLTIKHLMLIEPLVCHCIQFFDYLKLYFLQYWQIQESNVSAIIADAMSFSLFINVLKYGCGILNAIRKLTIRVDALQNKPLHVEWKCSLASKEWPEGKRERCKKQLLIKIWSF